jgi:hypothetical protein
MNIYSNYIHFSHLNSLYAITVNQEKILIFELVLFLWQKEQKKWMKVYCAASGSVFFLLCIKELYIAKHTRAHVIDKLCCIYYRANILKTLFSSLLLQTYNTRNQILFLPFLSFTHTVTHPHPHPPKMSRSAMGQQNNRVEVPKLVNFAVLLFWFSMLRI